MKALILTILAFTSLFAFAPKADAGYYERRVQYYDRCGRPVYSYVYRDDCRVPYRPSYHHYRSSYRYSRGSYCEPRHYSYSSRPRVSVRIGF